MNELETPVGKKLCYHEVATKAHEDKGESVRGSQMCTMTAVL